MFVLMHWHFLFLGHESQSQMKLKLIKWVTAWMTRDQKTHLHLFAVSCSLFTHGSDLISQTTSLIHWYTCVLAFVVSHWFLVPGLENNGTLICLLNKTTISRKLWNYQCVLFDLLSNTPGNDAYCWECYNIIPDCSFYRKKCREFLCGWFLKSWDLAK